MSIDRLVAERVLGYGPHRQPGEEAVLRWSRDIGACFAEVVPAMNAKGSDLTAEQRADLRVKAEAALIAQQKAGYEYPSGAYVLFSRVATPSVVLAALAENERLRAAHEEIVRDCDEWLHAVSISKVALQEGKPA